MMESFNIELMKTITELKALPKKDRKAIEQQLSGLDRIAVKKAFKIKPLKLSEDIVEEEIHMEAEDEEYSTPDISNFSPWLNKQLSVFLQAEENSAGSLGVAQAVMDVLPNCIEQANSDLEGFTLDNGISDTSGFKSILLKLRGGES